MFHSAGYRSDLQLLECTSASVLLSLWTARPDPVKDRGVTSNLKEEEYASGRRNMSKFRGYGLKKVLKATATRKVILLDQSWV